MKRIYLILVCIFLAEGVQAQLANEWIDFNQLYFKIPVAKDGLYKIDYAALQSAGFPAGIDPKNIQLYHRGIEQSIYVEGEDDHQFDPGDYLEFYGMRNDGTLDKDLYKEASRQPHPYYNLYSDTTSYFLTVGNATGKRMAFFSEVNGGLASESYQVDEKRVLFTNQYNTGPDFDILVQYSYFDYAEGWTGTQVTQGTSITNTFTGIVNTAPGAGNPELEMVIVGRGPMEHFANVYAGGTLAGTVSFSGVNSYKFTQTIDWATIAADGTLPIRLDVIGAGAPDRMSISYMQLRYPQQVNAAGQSDKTMILAPNGVNKSYVEIQNPPANARLFDISDPNSVNRIGTTLTTTLNAVVPNTAVSKKLYISSTTLAPAVKAVRFRKIIPAEHDYIIISHPLLRKPAGEYADPVKAYADFRASAAGGSYDTLVVNIGQLFDQFNYGESSPRAIFQFMKYLTASHVPKYLFLIGKGLELNRFNYYRNPTAFLPYRDFVPTSGLPGSDTYFTAGLAGTKDEPAVPTGRIAATKPADIAAYLNKVKETTARPFDDLRRKHVLHLSGGIEEGEPEEFRDILAAYAPVAKGLYLGGHVSAIAKRSKDIQLVNIAEEINKGLNLVTFFGHSSAVNLDFDIGFVTNPVLGYNNPGKYPMMIMNGCNVGSFFLNTVVFGEDWINASNKGAVGFIAHSSYGLVGTLQYYSETFYNVAYADSTYLHKGIGDIQKETARRYIATIGSSVTNTTQVQQMVLLGDPAVPLFGASKSDLEINSNNVSIASFNGEPVTAFTDSFAVKMVIRNFGQARKDTMEVRVKRYLNDNSFILYDSLYPSVYYSDTLSMVIRKGRENGGGNNRFEVTIDPDNVIDELNENNNSTTIEVPIAVNGTRNLYPVNFSIVHNTTTSVSWQATDILSGERDFVLQVDTVNTFASAYKKEFAVKGNVLARQSLSLLTKDSLVYYWRTRLANPLPGESDAWTLSSFTFIQNSPDGWAQLHFPQYLENTVEGLVADATQRKLTFKETVTAVSIRTFGGSNPAPLTDVSVKINGAEYNLYTQGFGCARDRFALVAFDRRSTVPYAGIPLKWYENAGRNCGREPLVINNFYYTQMATGSHDIIEYVNNVTLGDSVVMFSIGDALYQNWPAAAKVKLGELGLSVAQIEALQPGEPVIVFGRKGLAPGQAKVFRTAATPVNQQPLAVDKTMTGGYTSGTMTSALIGPALEWESFIARIRSKEVQDIASFTIIGLNLKGEEHVLFKDITGDQDLSGVDATTYPYLKLVYKTQDDLNLTPAQLRKWLVLYTPVPEGLLIFKNSATPQLLTEGSTWRGSYGFINISDKIFNSPLTVQYELFNQNNRESLMQKLDIDAPAPGDTTFFDIQFETTDRVGLNDVNVYVNPHIVPEQYYDNNILSLPGYLDVSSDIFKPVLDVTIDGRHVEHGDFVSANPSIEIRIWDENRNLLKTDTTGIRIFLTYPCDGNCSPTLIRLKNTDVMWTPATLSTDFTLWFRPTDLAPGNYVLLVEAADSRNNSSGATPYQIDFVVQSDLSINVSDPYPNPSILEVYFNVVLAGQELPSEFTLSIMDITGKQVRTFTRNDLQDFHIGINYLTWNGTDANGTRVPAGIYVYKIQLSMQGQHVVKNGKIVLLR